MRNFVDEKHVDPKLRGLKTLENKNVKLQKLNRTPKLKKIRNATIKESVGITKTIIFCKE